MTDTTIYPNTLNILALDYQMGTNWLFQNLNANFKQEITAIVGENGCGKSTLLRILCGLCKPTKGHILLNGQALYQSKHSGNPPLSYVPNVAFLYSHLTVLENLRFVGQLRKCDPYQLKKQISLTLQRCDLNHWQHILFNQLSDGLKKRVCIASSLLHDPSIIVLDEPCSELDPLQRNHLWELFKILKNQGKCILFTSHHVKEIQPFCDAIYLLHQGQLHPIENEGSSVSLLFQKTPSSHVMLQEGELA